MKIIMKMLQEKRTWLVVRNVYATLKDSTFSLFNEIIADLGLSGVIKSVKSPLEIHFPNGGKVIFRGGDDKEKLRSINNVSGIFIEELTEIKEELYKELVGRLRHPSLPLHMIMATNPVSKSSWVYKMFFKDEENGRVVLDDEDFYGQKGLVIGKTYYHHSTYHDNRFLPKSYCENLEETKEYDPDYHRVAALGRFGTSGTRVLPNLEVMPHDEVMKAVMAVKRPMRKIGCDWGFVTSYNALSDSVVDHDKKILYVTNEYYKKGITDIELADDLKAMGYDKLIMKGDGAEPKTIYYLQQRGFRIRAAKKFPGSRKAYTKKMRMFKKIIISDKCVNHIKELKDLTFKVNPKTNEMYEDEYNIDAHTMSSLTYSLDDYELATFKGATAKMYK